MPALHNYVTVDTAAFVSNPAHVAALYNMSRSMLLGQEQEPGEDPECHAAKLLEVMLLQCPRPTINDYVPHFLQVIIEVANGVQ